MNQYKVSLHYNMRGPGRSLRRNRTLIWDKEERPTYINRLVRKKITGRLAAAFIKNTKSHTLEELKTTPRGRQWIKEIGESKVREYKTKP